jgi:hypothetical protein
MSEKQPHMRNLVDVTVEDRVFVARHLACGHTLRFECLFGEAGREAAAARHLIGTKVYCTQCAAEQEDKQ